VDRRWLYALVVGWALLVIALAAFLLASGNVTLSRALLVAAVLMVPLSVLVVSLETLPGRHEENRMAPTPTISEE